MPGQPLLQLRVLIQYARRRKIPSLEQTSEKMVNMAEECLSIINEGHFSFVDPGPLHAPIRSFAIRRDDKLGLVLETKCAVSATSTSFKHAPGTVRLNIERAELANPVGREAQLVGLQRYSLNKSYEGAKEGELTECAQVDRATVSLGGNEAAAYTIDWLENLPVNSFIWPHSFETTVNTTESRRIGPADGSLTISKNRRQIGGSQSAAKLEVSGVTLYLCALRHDSDLTGIHPGCIVYDGTPDDAFRKKIRTALSFSLGLYLIDLGHTDYDQGWNIVSAHARSAYSLGRRAFELGSLQPAPLGSRYRNELSAGQLNRALSAFVSYADRLDLANLGWAYWHACAATPHIAPAHFGAAIEALQRAYLKANPNTISETWLPKQSWNKLKDDIVSLIGRTDTSDEAKAALLQKLPNFNQVEQRALLKAVFASLGLQLSEAEDTAWRRRNKSAHGMPIPEGQELEAIRDQKLLRGVFQRLLLRISNAADMYIDYTSPHHPSRRLEDAPPAIAPQ